MDIVQLKLAEICSLWGGRAMASKESEREQPRDPDGANRAVLIRFAILVFAVLLLSFTAPAGQQAVQIVGMLQVLFFVSLLFAAITRERPSRDRLTRFDEAAGFLALSLLVQALTSGATHAAAPGATLTS